MKQFLQTIQDFVRTHRKFDYVVLALGLAVFIAIALINAPRASIWFDEAFSAYIIQFNFLEIARFTATDVHPPMYYWVLKIWSEAFGTTELALRSLSVLFGAGAITFGYLFSRKYFGRTIAAVSLLFLVISPMLIRYSDEARMYAMAALIVTAATYVLAKASDTNRKSLWVVYGVLVSLGMWTHYFTAFAWLAHWVWRAFEIKQKVAGFKPFIKAFFSREWLWVHILAIGLFVPWLVVMVKQFTTVQSGGFWIGQIGVNTPVNYLTNYFYYLNSDQTHGWFALVLVAVLIMLGLAAPKAYRSLKRQEKSKFLLIASVAVVAPVLLILISLPPLHSSFVERYLVPSILALSITMAVVLVAGTRHLKPWLRVVPIVLVAGMFLVGMTNVYYYGNFNKNSNTHIMVREIMDEVIKNAEPGQPIVANSPWTFYEAIFYATDEHPVYFIDANTQYLYGSLDMLKDRSQHKIVDLETFEETHPTIWYIGFSEDSAVYPFKSDWVNLRTVSVYDKITDRTTYRGTEYSVDN